MNDCKILSSWEIFWANPFEAIEISWFLWVNIIGAELPSCLRRAYNGIEFIPGSIPSDGYSTGLNEPFSQL